MDEELVLVRYVGEDRGTYLPGYKYEVRPKDVEGNVNFKVLDGSFVSVKVEEVRSATSGAIRLAKEQGISLGNIPGTGKITVADVRKAVRGGSIDGMSSPL